MNDFELSLERAKSGNPKINTSEAACDLYYLLLERYGEPQNTTRIQIRNVQYGVIEFRVNVTIFKFTYKISKPASLEYRHMESDRWHRAHFYLGAKDAVKALINIVSHYGFDAPPSPVSGQKEEQ